MTKTAFISRATEPYSSTLMQIYLEKNGYKAYEFFSVDEMSLYEKLQPTAIIYDQRDEKQTKKFAVELSQAGIKCITTIGIDDKKLYINTYSCRAETGESKVSKLDTYNRIIEILDAKINKHSNEFK